MGDQRNAFRSVNWLTTSTTVTTTVWDTKWLLDGEEKLFQTKKAKERQAWRRKKEKERLERIRKEKEEREFVEAIKPIDFNESKARTDSLGTHIPTEHASA